MPFFVLVALLCLFFESLLILYYAALGLAHPRNLSVSFHPTLAEHGDTTDLGTAELPSASPFCLQFSTGG
jgi:hypothetical protein